MNTVAIVTTFTVLGSLAFAAGQEAALRPQPAGAVTRSPVHEDGAVSQRHHGTTMPALAGGDGSCTVGEPLNWFTQVHPLPDCLSQGGMSSWIPYMENLVNLGRLLVDVDGDGTADRLVAGRFYEDGSSQIFATGGWSDMDKDFAILWGTVTSLRGHEVSVERYALLNVSVLAEFVSDSGYGTVGSYTLHDLQDIDHDGDVDLLCSVGGEFGSRWVWIENTVKTNPPLAADINRDGVVDGKDLASVLAAWTP